MPTEPSTILVGGALGNLGWKVLSHLARHSPAGRLVGVDLGRPGPEHLETLKRLGAERGDARPRVELHSADLTDWTDLRWREPLARADAVVHFAGQNPRPEATWQDVTASLDMTANLVAAAAESDRLRRFVFASSSHVMGGYKDARDAGSLTADLEPSAGAVWNAGTRRFDSTPYASQKLAGERMCRTLARRRQGFSTVVAVRVGWCQVGPNSPETISAAGTPSLEPVEGAVAEADPEVARAGRWFEDLWISNRDLATLFERALSAESDGWPEGFAIVNGMSRNRGMRWSLEEGRRWLQWEPVDDVHDARRRVQ